MAANARRARAFAAMVNHTGIVVSDLAKARRFCDVIALIHEPAPNMLASGRHIRYSPRMIKRSASFMSGPAAFAGETARALFSTLLLLGLSGDRRAR